MAGPGGSEVARVSVKVVPDSDGFGPKLKADLQKAANGLEIRVPVRFDLDKAQLRAELEAMTVPTIHVPVKVDLPKPPPKVPVDADTSKAKRKVDEFDAETRAKKPKVKVDADIDRNTLQRRIETANLKAKLDIDQARLLASVKAATAAAERVATIKAKVDVDRRSFSTLMSDLVRAVGNSGLGKAFSNLGNVGASAMGSIGKGAGDLLTSMTDTKSVAAGLAKALLLAGTYGTAFALAGAAITAAWAAVSTAIAAVPAAIALIGAPIAAVALGMDGIKAAARTLKPEFDALKKAISDTFKTELTPVFRDLKSIMPTLQTGLTGTASALSSVAKGLAEFVTSAEGVKLIKDLFTNVNQAIRDMEPGIVNLVRGFLQLAGNKAALDALSGTVNKLGENFAAMVEKLSRTGQLDVAFTGLQGVLESLATAFIKLMENGVRAFSTMAPGIKTFVDSLTNFFGKFDWEGIGVAVGNVFQGIGDAINGIPQSTIDAIKQAFVQLGEAFKDPAVARFIQNLASALPGIIGDIGDFVTGVASVGNAIKDVIDFMEDMENGTTGVWFLDASLPELASAAWDAVKSVLSSAWSAIVNEASTEWESLKDVASTAWTAVSDFISGAVDAITTTVSTWATNIGTFFSSAWDGLTSIVQTVWTAITTFISTALQTVLTTLQTWATNIGTFFSTAWTTITTAVQTAWTTITTFISTTLQTILTTLQTWATNVGLFFTTAWTTITTGVQTAWTTITTLISTAVQTILTTLQTWATNIGTFFTTAWQTVTTIVQTAWTTITTLISTAVQTVLTTVQGWGQNIVSFLQQTWTNVQTAVQTAWTTLVQTVQTGVQNVLQFFQQLPGQVVSALSSLASQLADIGRNAINSLVNAIRSGASAVVNAIVSVVTAAIRAAKAALGIGSPSKVFRGFGGDTWDGFIRGSDGMRAQVLDSIKAITNDVISLGRETADAFQFPEADIQSRLGQLETQLVASGQPLAGDALTTAQTIINNVYNPVAEKASDSIQRKLRTLGALGLLGAPA